MRCSGLTEQQKDDVVLYDKPPKNYVCSLCKALPKGAAKGKGGQKRAAPGAGTSKKGAEKAADGGEWEPGDDGAPPPAKRPPGRPPLERSESKKGALKKKLLPSKRGRPPGKR